MASGRKSWTWDEQRLLIWRDLLGATGQPSRATASEPTLPLAGLLFCWARRAGRKHLPFRPSALAHSLLFWRRAGVATRMRTTDVTGHGFHGGHFPWRALWTVADSTYGATCLFFCFFDGFMDSSLFGCILHTPVSLYYHYTYTLCTVPREST